MIPAHDLPAMYLAIEPPYRMVGHACFDEPTNKKEPPRPLPSDLLFGDICMKESLSAPNHSFMLCDYCQLMVIPGVPTVRRRTRSS